MRRYSYILVILLILTGCAGLQTREPKMTATDTIIRKCQEIESQLNCRLALSFEDLQSGHHIGYRENESFHAASLMKVPVMIELFRRIRLGEFDLDDPIHVHKDFISISSGSTFICDGSKEMESLIGKSTTIRRLTELMIQISDNLATNLLIEKLGAANITRTIQYLGTNNTYVLRGVMDIDAFEKGLNNTTSARDMTLLMTRIAKRNPFNQKHGNQMIDILYGQQYRSLIPALLPPEAKIGNKTGSIEKVQHDSAFVFYNDKAYAISILSDQLDDMNAGKQHTAQLSLDLFNLWLSGRLKP